MGSAVGKAIVCLGLLAGASGAGACRGRQTSIAPAGPVGQHPRATSWQTTGRGSPTADVAASPAAPTVSVSTAAASQQAPPGSIVLGPTTELAAQAADALAGTSWQWVGSNYNNEDAIEADDPAKYSIRFGSDGSFVALADCNTVTGQYSAKGGSLAITNLVTTMAVCAEGSLSGPFLQDLASAATFLLQGDTLLVNMKMDVGDMRFRASP